MHPSPFCAKNIKLVKNDATKKIGGAGKEHAHHVDWFGRGNSKDVLKDGQEGRERERERGGMKEICLSFGKLAREKKDRRGEEKKEGEINQKRRRSTEGQKQDNTKSKKEKDRGREKEERRDGERRVERRREI